MREPQLIPHTAAWYDRLATLQVGYRYPWRSRIGHWHGEDAYLALVGRHLSSETDVLDVACGHGAVAVEIAPRVRSVLAYDRTAAWIELGRQAARERGQTNVTFVCHDSSPGANGGQVRLPAPDASFDLLICSKGPFHWIDDARRVARPGAALLMLVPDAPPATAWHAGLPEPLRWPIPADPHWARPSIERRLASVGVALESWWSFDVPEVFADPESLYAWLTWGSGPDDVPTFGDVRPVLERIFREHAAEHPVNDRFVTGVAIRRRRYLWKSVTLRSGAPQRLHLLGLSVATP